MPPVEKNLRADFKVSEDFIRIGEKVHVKVSMFNDSGLSYEDLICLFVNDRIYSTKKILVPPGIMEDMLFEVIPSETGKILLFTNICDIKKCVFARNE